VAFWAAELKLIYYAEPFYAIESSGGLTDTVVAHEAISERGRPGHEKVPTAEYLEHRKVNFFLGPMAPPPPGQQVLNAILFENILAKIIVYDDTVMSALEHYPGVRFVRMPDYLDAYIAGLDTLDRARVEADYRNFKAFYFDHNNDPRREAPFLSKLAPAPR
jgi:hypothetical protein